MMMSAGADRPELGWWVTLDPTPRADQSNFTHINPMIYSWW